MIKTVVSFNGHVINDSSYRAALLNAASSPSARPVFIDAADDDPGYAGTFAVDVRNLAVYIQVLNYANRNSLEEQLKRWFKRGERGSLVVTFSDDGLSYQMMDCVVVSLIPEEGYPGRFTAILQAGQTSWRAVTADTDTWNVSGTGGTKSISVGGSDKTALSLSMVVSAAPSAGYLYQNVLQIVNVPGVAIGNRTWCVTVNHAALVAGGKSLSSGYDLRLFARGKEIKRWIPNPNNASTKIFFNLNVAAGRALNLKTAVASSGSVTKLVFDLTHPDTKAHFAKLPSAGVLYHGTEWFSYGNKAAAGHVWVGARAIYGTTMQAHSAGDVFYYIQWPVVLMYGKATATNPTTGNTNYDDEKPVLNLSSSTNTSFVWDNTGVFVDTAKPMRTAQWSKLETRQGSVSKIFSIKQNATSGDPALGAKAGSFASAGQWRQSSVSLSWTFSSATELASIAMTGDKYRTGTPWMDDAKIQSSIDGIEWVDVRSDATPGSAASWTAWTLTTTSLAAGTKFVRLLFEGIYPGGASGYAAYEALTATVAFTGGALPTMTFLGEQANATLDMSLTNNANGQSLSLLFPLLLNKTFALDGENYLVQYNTANAHDAMTLDDPGRQVWIELEIGSNQLQIDSNGVGTMAISLSWYKRRFG